MRRDTPRALAEIRQADLDKLSFFHGIAAVIYAEAGMQAEAAAAGKRFLELVWGFACQALIAAAPPVRLLGGVRPVGTGDDDRRGARSRARTSAPQPCIRSARDRAGP